jgi:L-ascorbate metabolism protein UlaG (beta-lactamase superfamily)
VVVISHDHYDHLDMPTIQILASRGTRFVVPLGVGAHLQAWGVLDAQVAELDWGDQAEVARLKIIATPARHYSGRNPLRAGQAFWASWVIQAPTHRVFFSGDSGYTGDFKTVGEKYGPFDVTLMKIGASDPSWADIHMTPEEAVLAHGDLKGAVMLPIHWGTFNMAFHAWNEPADRVVAAARNAGISLAVPRPGEFVEPNQSPAVDCWWAQGSVRSHTTFR